MMSEVVSGWSRLAGQTADESDGASRGGRCSEPVARTSPFRLVRETGQGMGTLSSPVMVTPDTPNLVTAILREARSRGVDLDDESVTMEGDLPVLRVRLGRRVLRTTRIRLPGPPGSRQPDVITVQGSGHRSSKMWPRKRDGSFAITAVVDHLLELVRRELEHARPDAPVASGVPAAASGVHVLHTAGILLGTITGDANPDALVARITDLTIRNRIDGHLRTGGLTDGDLRALGKALRLSVGRSLKLDDTDPFEPINADILSLLRLGRHHGSKVELRYALLLERSGNRMKLADPAGQGIVEVPIGGDVATAWELGALGGKPWLGTVSVARW